MFFVNGGYGAARGRDGAHVLSWPSNVSSTPVEMIEQLVPLKVRYRRFRVGSGGDGEFRGGNGQEVLFESRAPAPITVAFLAERTRPEAAPAGIAGGGPGASGELLIDGERVNPKSQHAVARAARCSYARRPAAGTVRLEAHARTIDADRADGYISGMRECSTQKSNLRGLIVQLDTAWKHKGSRWLNTRLGSISAACSLTSSSTTRRAPARQPQGADHAGRATPRRGLRHTQPVRR